MLEPISVQLAWLHQFQSAGFYVAKEKGFYEELDLNVTIKEYQQGMNVVNSVVSKESTYGVGKSSLVIDRNNGKPVVAHFFNTHLLYSSPQTLSLKRPKTFSIVLS